MTPDEAIELIDRAEHAEDDRGLRLLLEGMGERQPLLGSLRSRLELIIMSTTLGPPKEVLRAMGTAFVENAMVPEAFEYIHEAWERTTYTTDLHLRSGYTVEGIRNDIAEAIVGDMRKRATSSSHSRATTRSPKRVERRLADPRSSLDRFSVHYRSHSVMAVACGDTGSENGKTDDKITVSGLAVNHIDAASESGGFSSPKVSVIEMQSSKREQNVE